MSFDSIREVIAGLDFKSFIRSKHQLTTETVCLCKDIGQDKETVVVVQAMTSVYCEHFLWQEDVHGVLTDGCWCHGLCLGNLHDRTTAASDGFVHHGEWQQLHAPNLLHRGWEEQCQGVLQDPEVQSLAMTEEELPSGQTIVSFHGTGCWPIQQPSRRCSYPLPLSSSGPPRSASTSLDKKNYWATCGGELLRAQSMLLPTPKAMIIQIEEA